MLGRNWPRWFKGRRNMGPVVSNGDEATRIVQPGPVATPDKRTSANVEKLIFVPGRESPVKIEQITEPSIYVVQHSQLTYDTQGNIELDRFLKEQTRTKGEKQPYFFLNQTDTTQDPYDLDNIPEIAGRLCYMSFDKPRPGGNGTYLEHIRETGHGSVLEHASVGFILTGVSRSLTHELVRHRAGFAFSQLSQRFVDHEPTSDTGAWLFICPLALLNRPRAIEIWERSVASSAAAYEELSIELARDFDPSPTSGVPAQLPKLSLKQQREAARSVLPNSTETKIFVTCNFRALRHLFHMRGSIHADREIRRFARRLYDSIKDLDISKELLSDVTISDDEQDVLTVGYPKV